MIMTDMREFKRAKVDSKEMGRLRAVSVQCSCSNRVPAREFKDGVALCKHCGNVVFRTPMDEFRYRAKEKMAEKSRTYKVFDLEQETLESIERLEIFTWSDNYSTEYDKKHKLLIVEEL